MTKKIRLKINLLRHTKNAGILGTALSHAAVKTAVPVQEKTTLHKVPKTMKTPST